jgi:hypothetical protein
VRMGECPSGMATKELNLHRENFGKDASEVGYDGIGPCPICNLWPTFWEGLGPYYYGISKRTPRKIWLVDKRIGVIRPKYNEFNDLDEIRDLAEIIKHDKYIDYNTASTTETPANNYFIT